MYAIYSDFLYIPRSHVQDPNQFIARFRVLSKTGEVVNTAFLTRNYIAVPREVEFGRKMVKHYAISRGSPAALEWNPQYELTSSQREAVKSVLTTERGGGILHLLPGKGKTVLSLYLAALLKRKTVVFVHNKDLAKQWLDRAKTFLVDPKVSLVMASEGYEDWSGDIVIVSISTALNRKYSASFRRQFFLTIYDEAHHMEAPKFNQISHFNFGLRVGLTGTPYNMGYEDLYFRSIGPILYEDVTPELRSRYFIYNTGITPALYLNADFNDYLEWISEDNHRLELVTDLVSRLSACGRKILVLSSRVKLSEKMVEKIPNSALLIGKVKMEERDRIRTDKSISVVVATPQIAKEAIDVKWWDTLVIATPFSTRALQAVGRIIRKFPGKNEPWTIFIADNFRASEKHAYKFYRSMKDFFISKDKVSSVDQLLGGELCQRQN